MIAARGLAYCIDCVCVFGLFAVTQIVLFAPLRRMIGITEEWFRSGWNTEAYTLVTISIPVWLYFSMFESSVLQATLGKKLIGLRVVDPASLSRITFPRSVFRTIIKLLPWELAHLANHFPEPLWYADKPDFRISFVFSGVLLAIYVATICLHARHQGIHDLLAKTLVTRQPTGVGQAHSQ